ncbi:t-SNARE [Phyllosticta citricarpa]|uniref:t-SNARE n=2 Tax=Phyllosticta TaxID=121621 RepID=A0ABR1MQQ7_9PEZI
MSFDDSSRLESQPTTWRRQDDPEYSDDPEFRRFTSQLSDQLFSLTSNVTRLSNQIALLGTKRETERVRERVRDLIDETSNGFKEVGEGLKKVQQWPDLNASQKFTQGKLNREFKASLTEFQVLQRSAIEKERSSAAAARAALEDAGGSATSPSGQGPGSQQMLQEQEQLRLAPQDEVDFQESLIIERESEIRNIEQSVGELNELFRDVAHMVHEQGEQLDIISENVEGVRNDTRGANTELRTASRHQKAARNKACCLLVILAVVLTIVILAVVLG